MENDDTLIGFTTTPVYLIDPDDFSGLMQGGNLGGIFEELYGQAHGGGGEPTPTQ